MCVYGVCCVISQFEIIITIHDRERERETHETTKLHCTNKQTDKHKCVCILMGWVTRRLTHITYLHTHTRRRGVN